LEELIYLIRASFSSSSSIPPTTRPACHSISLLDKSFASRQALSAHISPDKNDTIFNITRTTANLSDELYGLNDLGIEWPEEGLVQASVAPLQAPIDATSLNLRSSERPVR
jgi:hypothetical protein